MLDSGTHRIPVDPRVAKTRLVALVGNPNTGKTTLFNALTGFRQRVANYPGVTVEKKMGRLRRGAANRAAEVDLLDLPGTYSLTARSKDEMVVTDVLLGRYSKDRRPDLVVAVVDASNLRRNLFLTTQIMEMGLPVVVALNMIDVAEGHGVRIDVDKLSRRIGVPVITTHAARQVGVDRLIESIDDRLGSPGPEHFPTMPEAVESELARLHRGLSPVNAKPQAYLPQRSELLQTLLEPDGFAERRLVEELGDQFEANLRDSRRRLHTLGLRLTDLEAHARYAWIENALIGVENRFALRPHNWSDRMDRLLTHRFFGFVVFFALMAVVFQAIYTWAAPLMDTIEGIFGGLASLVSRAMPDGALESLVVDGVIAGVGGVLVFLPQILILFFFIGILEDCGYMARGAMLLDRVMSLFGLNGKAFIPLLSSFACAVPGIMATRTIGNRSDRLVTILVAPLMSCSARLPVYTLLIAAFIPADTILGGWFGLQGLVLLAMYLVGVVVAIPVAMILRRAVFRERRQAFLMELPSYKWPQWKTVLFRVFERGREFVLRAGTIIFAVSILIWAAAYYPRPASIAQQFESRRQTVTTMDPAAREAELASLDAEEAGTYLRQSVLGRIGLSIEPAVVPLGWDWRIGMAAVASFPAREVIIATLGTIFNLGSDVDESSSDLRGALQSAAWPDGTPLFNLAVALSIMIFFALCCQCAATLAVMKRETHSWRWPIFAFTYMTALAYLAAWATYRVAVTWV